MKKLLKLALALGLVGGFAVGCSNDDAKDKGKDEKAPATETASSGELKVGRVNAAPHGDKSFASVVVVMNGDKIAVASLDEFQFMATATTKAVPNSDKAFGENYKDPAASVLGSKLDNADQYSKNMKEKGGATQTVLENYEAVQDYVKGKTVADLEKVLKENEGTPEKMVDVVSGSTLADTYGYVKVIAEAAKAAK